MKLNPFRLALFLFILVVGVAVAATVSTSWLTLAAAQDTADLWLSSADAPAGTPLERYSPPDVAVTAGSDHTPHSPEAPDVLVSWRVAGSALKPRTSDVSYAVNDQGGCTYVTSGDSYSVWNIQPMLPQGAVVDTLRMYFLDTSGSNSSAWFTVYNQYGAIVSEWPVSSSGNSGNGFNTSSLINHTIDYSQYSYLLNWRPIVTGTTMQLCGLRIFYTAPPFGLAFLPDVTRQHVNRE